MFSMMLLFELLGTLIVGCLIYKLVLNLGFESRKQPKETSSLLSKIVSLFLPGQKLESSEKFKEIPGPRPIPILGNALDIMRHVENILERFHIDWVLEYGELYKISLGSDVSVHVSSAEHVEELLKSTTLITKGTMYDLFKDWLGKGLVASEGSQWKLHRRLLTPAFHFQILNNFIPVFNEQSRILAKCIKEVQSMNPNNEVDIFPLVCKCTLAIICETAMGVSINVQNDNNSRYVKAIKKLSHYLYKRAFQPWLKSDLIFHLTPWGKDYRSSLKIIHNFVDQVIAEKKSQLHNRGPKLETNDSADDDSYLGKKERLAFLDLILASSEEGEGLTDKEIRDEVNTFMFAGHDTNSSAISWSLYLMANNPTEQEKVYEELKEVFGDSDRDCTQEDVRRLKFLECCIKESLRILPPASTFRRLVTEELKLGDYTVPVGWNITVLVYALHHNPKYFPDPETFKPERFLPENSAGRHPFAYIPFSAGPRNCIGQKFALIEQQVILSTLLRKFKVEPTPRTVLDPKHSVILRPRNELFLRFVLRK